MTVENIVGDLADAFKQADPATIQHAHEILNDIRQHALEVTGNIVEEVEHEGYIELRTPKEEALKNKWMWPRQIYTADFLLYDIEDEEPILYLANREHNLIFRHFDGVIKNLIKNQYNHTFRDPQEYIYRPPKEEVEEVKKANTTLRINLFECGYRLNGVGDVAYFDIFDFHYTGFSDITGLYNPTKKAFAERLIGQGDDFIKNREMLKKLFGRVRVYTLTHADVEKYAQQGAFAMVAKLNHDKTRDDDAVLGNNYNFFAHNQYTHFDWFLRAELLKKVGKTDVEKSLNGL